MPHKKPQKKPKLHPRAKEALELLKRLRAHGLRIEEIASRSHCSVATVYRWTRRVPHEATLLHLKALAAELAAQGAP